MLQDATIARLRDDLLAADYTMDAVSARLGAAGLAGLARNSAVAALDALGADGDRQATLIRLWMLQQPVPLALAQRALSRLEDLMRAGLLHGRSDEIRAGVELKPYAADEFSGWICSDQTPLDGRTGAPADDFVLGASPASTTLAQLTVRRPVAAALDLGTGCGVQSVHLSRHADRVVATDLNPRAVALTRVTLGLNRVDADVRPGSLFEPVAEERFDLIVTNPPYVMSPPDQARLIYREGGFVADDLMRRVIVDGAPHLAPGGLLQVLGNWAHTSGQDWTDRLREWIAPTGCDALVIQREVLDPYEYIEVWLADAGLAGTPEYLPAYRRWTEYFDHLGITGVGLGWITLANSGREQPHLTLQEWPHAVHQPVGEAFAGHFGALAQTGLPDADFLKAAATLDPRVVQETLGRPGAADPEHIVLRQRYGFGRAVEVDTALAAVVGACDGDLPLGVLIAAVGGLLGVDPDALAADLLPRLRTLTGEGFLRAG